MVIRDTQNTLYRRTLVALCYNLAQGNASFDTHSCFLVKINATTIALSIVYHYQLQAKTFQTQRCYDSEGTKVLY